ncbi:MAG: SDR family NAD(P)-dependent oxidoreductase [Solirubrobacteraceae bacterium]
MDLGLSGKRCLVTGASRGIGLATARLLAAEGARVFITARGEEELQRAARDCGAAGHLALDVTAPDAAARLLELAGQLHVLVNNAGTSSVRALEDLSDEEWQGQWELNVMAPMRLMRAVAPGMADRGWGRIVNVSSSSGKRPSLTNVAYSVTKAAELSLSRAFADSYAARGVLINAVAPGVVDTGLWLDPGGMADQVAAAQGISREEALASTGAKPPLGRFGTDEEIAAVIVFLCSERASNVAGAAWSVDGGSVPVIL